MHRPKLAAALAWIVLAGALDARAAPASIDFDIPAGPLADAVTEVNRYSPTRVRIADESLADLAVSGSFVAGDAKAAVAAFAAVLPLTVTEEDGELTIHRR